jgi:hypothetical protein
MSSTTTHFTKSFPKRGDITGSPEQAFHMLDNRDKYYKYLLGGISAGTIAALGTIAPGGSFQYLYAPQIYHDLGGKPNIVTGGRPISELDTRSLTKALRVMKAFITQVDLTQSMNSPIVVCRSNIYKYKVNSVNNTKCALSGYNFRADNTKANGASRTTKTQNSCCNEAASAILP